MADQADNSNLTCPLVCYGFITHGRLNGRVKASITDNLIVQARTEVSNAVLDMARVDFDYLAQNYVANFSLETRGVIGASYIQASLATEFVYNCFSRDVNTSIGYDCDSEMAQVQGKIGSNGVASAYLFKGWNMGLDCILSASFDLKNKDYMLGLSFSRRGK
ncbi:mitochondrial import receptor subunit TOM40-1-like [Capsella rubella]|uniref:mitochondrial import receptor subunit TOM40-1-like n=1 Tax=Capsella rubella TaxID=81985 RepID=UPI000CD555E4|nr:mitochondrial import receptor subunit TOM40-1-like [Capsella rubella]